MRRLAATVAAGLLGGALTLAAGVAHAATPQPSASAGASAAAPSSASASAPATASASGPAANPLCSAEVVDSAGVLSGDDIEQLRSAGQDLGQTTVLRIRTVAQVPGGDLNAYEKQLQQSCGWADAANQRQPTLLVVMVDTDDRQMGIYPGPALTPVLTDKVWLAIEQDAMRPAFAKADWTGGLQAGLRALEQLVGPGAAPSASFDPSALASAGAPQASAAQPVASEPAPGGVAAPPADTGGSDGFPVGAAVGFFALAAVIGIATSVFRRTSLGRPFGSGTGWEAGSSAGFTDGGSSSGGSDGGGGGGGSSSDGGGGSSGF